MRAIRLITHIRVTPILEQAFDNSDILARWPSMLSESVIAQVLIFFVPLELLSDTWALFQEGMSEMDFLAFGLTALPLTLLSLLLLIVTPSFFLATCHI